MSAQQIAGALTKPVASARRTCEFGPGAVDGGRGADYRPGFEFTVAGKRCAVRIN
ncbi:MAG: hypothetical protein ACJAVS_000800 [Paracoccaceae bacterium]